MSGKYKNLTQKKQRFIEYLKILTIERPAPAQIIKDVGISLKTYYRWLNDEELLEIVNIEKQKDFEDGLPDILQMLKKKALQGDTQSIKIYLERIEKHHKNSTLDISPDDLIQLLRLKKIPEPAAP